MNTKEKVLALIQNYLCHQEEFRVDLDDLDLKIYMKGKNWGGIVDRPTASFLLQLDKRIERELMAVGVEVPKTHHGILALRIEEGSLDAVFQYSKGILNQWNKMTARSQILVVLTLVASLGIVNFKEIVEALNKPALQEAENRARIELVKAIGDIAKNTQDLQKPVKALVQTMEPADVIQMPGTADLVKKNEAKKSLVQQNRSKSATFYVDHRYIVQELSTKKPGQWMITIAYGSVAFRAKLMLTTEEINSLLRDFQDAHARGSEIAPDMQVTAEITARGVQSASVIALGSPRQNAMRLSEALKKQSQ